MVTVIEAVDWPLFHSSVPGAVVERTVFPQLFVTVTTGVAGVDFGAATAEPASLAHPFTVVVTV